MKFLVSRSSYPKKTTSVIIEESGEEFFHLELPSGQDTVDGWYIRFLYLRKTQPQELNEFVAIIHRLLEIRVDEEAYSTYLKLMLGLYHWLEKEIEVLQEFGQDQQYLHSLQVNLGNALFRFQQFSETPLVEGSR